jgi:hypothetical protein
VHRDGTDRGLAWRFPLFRSLDGYRPAWVRRDLAAGVLIVAVAIPLSMGMAEVAGMPPVAGLYSCVLPLVASAVLGSSRQLVIALDASTAAMLAAAVAPLAGGEPLRHAALAGTVTLLVGGILVVAVAGAIRHPGEGRPGGTTRTWPPVRHGRPSRGRPHLGAGPGPRARVASPPCERASSTPGGAPASCSSRPWFASCSASA